MAKDDYTKALDNFSKYINHLASGGLRRIGRQQLKAVVNRVHKMVKAKYRQEASKSKSRPPWMQRAYDVGKEQGAVRPARITRAMSTMEELGENVVIEESGERLSIRVDPSLVSSYRQDAPLALVADWIENGREMHDTWRSMIYRIMMQENRGGIGTRRRQGVWGQPHLPEGLAPTGAIFVIRAHPVWKPVANDMVRKDLMKICPIEIRARLVRLARQFGAEVVQVSGSEVGPMPAVPRPPFLG